MNTRMNGDTKTTEQMMHEALDKLLTKSRAANVGEVRDVRLIVRHAPTVGRRVHASGSVKVHFSECVVEHPVPVLDAEIAKY